MALHLDGRRTRRVRGKARGGRPRTVRSVTATAYDAPDDVAAVEFLSYVVDLVVVDTDPANPRCG